jgi:hypothetical protein
MNVGLGDGAAIAAVPYASAIKAGLQFKRRFWEEDDHIYGGITYTDLPITNIGYPNTGFFSGGKGVLLGAYIWGLNAMEFTAMTPQERVQKAVDYGSQIHPQYQPGIRQRCGRRLAPFALHHGMLRHVEHRYPRQALRRSVPDRQRIVLAGEHASFIGGWQEGAVTSALDAGTGQGAVGGLGDDDFVRLRGNVGNDLRLPLVLGQQQIVPSGQLLAERAVASVCRLAGDARVQDFMTVAAEAIQQPPDCRQHGPAHAFVKRRPGVIRGAPRDIKRRRLGPPQIRVLHIDDEQSELAALEHRIRRLRSR